MKNLVNYLDDYFDENIEETLCNRKFKGKIKNPKDLYLKKANKEETQAYENKNRHTKYKNKKQ